MNKATVEQDFRELTISELEEISGGAKWKCSIEADSGGKGTVKCEISGEF